MALLADDMSVADVQAVLNYVEADVERQAAEDARRVAVGALAL
jgi:hypothetical protein